MAATSVVLSSTLQQDFSVSFTNELKEFSTEFATAYEAMPNKGDHKSKYYGLILHQDFAPDLRAINALRDLDEEGVQKLVDFGKYSDSTGKENLCIILKRPKGKSLSQLIKEGRVFDENFIVNSLLSKIVIAIKSLHDNEIAHGRINLETIYYNEENAQLTIRESISEYPGYSQKASFETFNRITCHPAGKKNDDFSADYYALGVLICNILAGGNPFDSVPNNLVARMKFENGSYDIVKSMTLARVNLKISLKTENLLKGLLHDKESDRWKDTHLKKWSKNEISQAVQSRIHRQSSVPFIFDGQEYYNPKFLSYEFQEKWIVAKNEIKLADLSRWISFNSEVPDVERKLYNMTQGWQTEVVIPDEKLARFIYLMDNEGPLRYKELTFHPKSLGNLVSFLFSKGDEETLQKIYTVIDFGLLEGWISYQEDRDSYKKSRLGWSAAEIKSYARKKELGFGMERVLYETSEFMPCQSTMLEKTYSIGLAAVLVNLDKQNLSYNEKDRPGTHLCSYITAKCGIIDSIKIKQLQSFPQISKMNEVKFLAIFAFAQDKLNIKKLENVSKWLNQGLENVIEKLNSKSIKDNLRKKLAEASATGDLRKLFKVITNKKYVRSDISGYREAKKQYKILNFQILKMNSRSNLDMLAYRLGLRISVIFSYLVCAISILSIMIIHS